MYLCQVIGICEFTRVHPRPEGRGFALGYVGIRLWLISTRG